MTLALLGATLAGCGGAKDAGEATTTAVSSSPSPAPGAATLPANLDQGPRAGESEADEARAKLGEALFKDKGCSACHAFGKRVTGPDLAGVTMRRTAVWMENQILHPDLMVKQDPISRGLFAQFALQMPNQGLTADEARSVIEYFKHQDHEAGEAQAAGKEKH
jgi:mono/diheme cytochrome c family protein